MTKRQNVHLLHDAISCHSALWRNCKLVEDTRYGGFGIFQENLGTRTAHEQVLILSGQWPMSAITQRCSIRNYGDPASMRYCRTWRCGDAQRIYPALSFSNFYWQTHHAFDRKLRFSENECLLQGYVHAHTYID